MLGRSASAPVKRLLRAAALSAAAAVVPRNADIRPVPEDSVIRSPGNYRLDRDIQATGPAGIKIDANAVSLDLANHRITAAPATPGRQTFAIAGRRIGKLSIRNGTLAGGWCGLHLAGLRTVDIADIVFEDNDQIGLVSLECRNLRVTGCRFNMTIKPLVRPKGERYTVGMNVSGNDIVLARNNVNITYDSVEQDDPPLETIGILIGANSRNVRITGNHVSTKSALPASYGIWAGSGCLLEAVSGNVIENVDYGLAIADSSVAQVVDNSFTCAPDLSRTGNQRVCTAALFARAADLHESANRIDGYASSITRYDPVASGHQSKGPVSAP